MPENPMQWNDKDAAMLRDYLVKNPKFINELANQIPPRTPTETMEAKSLNAELREGARHTIHIINKLAYTDRTPEQQPGFIDPGKI
jgi:hypothetical protein